MLFAGSKSMQTCVPACRAVSAQTDSSGWNDRLKNCSVSVICTEAGPCVLVDTRPKQHLAVNRQVCIASGPNSLLTCTATSALVVIHSSRIRMFRPDERSRCILPLMWTAAQHNQTPTGRSAMQRALSRQGWTRYINLGTGNRLVTSFLLQSRSLSLNRAADVFFRKVSEHETVSLDAFATRATLRSGRT
jgi:hypothetical protein